MPRRRGTYTRVSFTPSRLVRFIPKTVGRTDYRYCIQCGADSRQVGELSHQRLCRECGHENLNQSVLQQQECDGPIFQRWRVRIAASVGAVPLDYLTPRP